VKRMYWVIFTLGVGAMSANAQLPGVDAPTGSRGKGESARSESPPVAPPKESPKLKDPAELCQKLGGVEREICARQAQEKREPVDPRGTGAASGGGGYGSI